MYANDVVKTIDRSMRTRVFSDDSVFFHITSCNFLESRDEGTIKLYMNGTVIHITIKTKAPRIFLISLVMPLFFKLRTSNAMVLSSIKQ